MSAVKLQYNYQNKFIIVILRRLFTDA